MWVFCRGMDYYSTILFVTCIMCRYLSTLSFLFDFQWPLRLITITQTWFHLSLSCATVSLFRIPVSIKFFFTLPIHLCLAYLVVFSHGVSISIPLLLDCLTSIRNQYMQFSFYTVILLLCLVLYITVVILYCFLFYIVMCY
jgi:hypothetical protein